MDLLKQTKNLCKLYHIIPARSKGQNFLIEEKVYDDIIATADLKPYDVVLEVGPGLGFLTAKLAEKAGRVIAVELDNKLAEALKTGLAVKGIDNVEVVNEDVLKLEIGNPPGRTRPNGHSSGRMSVRTGWKLGKANTNFKFQISNFKVVANLPYNITSIFLRKFLEAENKPELMVLMLQKEVAERICSRTGEMSLLAVSVQFYAKPEIVEIVGKENFWPKPEVDSAIVRIVTNPPNPLSARTTASPTRSFWRGVVQSGGPARTTGVQSGGYQGGKIEKDFFRLVKFGFSAKRKMLKNNLAVGFKMSQAEAENKITKAGFNGKIRAQELSVDDWLKLFNVFN